MGLQSSKYPTSTFNVKFIGNGQSAYNVNMSDDILNINTSGGEITISLPKISSSGLKQSPKKFIINDIGGFADAFPITIKGLGGDLVNGQSSVTIEKNLGTAQCSISSFDDWAIVTDSPINIDQNGFEFLKRVFFKETVFDSGSSLDLNLRAGNLFFINATNNFTMDYLNSKSGTYIIVIKQDATGSRVMTLASNKFSTPNGEPPVLSTAPNSIDVFSAVYSEEGAVMLLFSANNFQLIN